MQGKAVCPVQADKRGFIACRYCSAIWMASVDGKVYADQISVDGNECTASEVIDNAIRLTRLKLLIISHGSVLFDARFWY